MSDISYKSATISNIKAFDEIPYATVEVPGLIQLAENIDNYTDTTTAVTPALMQPVLADITNRITYNEADEQFLSKTAASTDYLSLSDAETYYLTKNDASITYLTIERATSTYTDSATIAATYISKNEANSKYLTINDANVNYVKIDTEGTTHIEDITTDSGIAKNVRYWYMSPSSLPLYSTINSIAVYFYSSSEAGTYGNWYLGVYQLINNEYTLVAVSEQSVIPQQATQGSTGWPITFTFNNSPLKIENTGLYFKLITDVSEEFNTFNTNANLVCEENIFDSFIWDSSAEAENSQKRGYQPKLSLNGSKEKFIPSTKSVDIIPVYNKTAITGNYILDPNFNKKTIDKTKALLYESPIDQCLSAIELLMSNKGTAINFVVMPSVRVWRWDPVTHKCIAIGESCDSNFGGMLLGAKIYALFGYCKPYYYPDIKVNAGDLLLFTLHYISDVNTEISDDFTTYINASYSLNWPYMTQISINEGFSGITKVLAEDASCLNDTIANSDIAWDIGVYLKVVGKAPGSYYINGLEFAGKDLLAIKWENNELPSGVLKEYEYIDETKVIWAITDDTFAATGITLSDVFDELPSTFIGNITLVIKNSSSVNTTCVISSDETLAIMAGGGCLIKCFCSDGAIMTPIKITYP